jgi:hypothetical protein
MSKLYIGQYGVLLGCVLRINFHVVVAQVAAPGLPRCRGHLPMLILNRDGVGF